MGSLQGQMNHGVFFVSGKPHKRNGLEKPRELGHFLVLQEVSDGSTALAHWEQTLIHKDSDLLEFKLTHAHLRGNLGCGHGCENVVEGGRS